MELEKELAGISQFNKFEKDQDKQFFIVEA